MSFLKNVLQDLVEKRLWPVAIALVAALVAVPILLGGSSSPQAAAPVDVAAATTTNGLANHRDVAREQVISLEEQAAGKVERSGKVRDPFVQHHQPKPVKLVTAAAKTVSSALSGTSTTTSTGGTSDSTPTTTTAPTTTTTTPTTTTKKPDSTSVDAYRVKLSFGEVGAQKSYDNVARLTPLPSSDNPFFVYLGLADDQKSAVFLINADAVPNGDGHCTPSTADCQQVTLKAGDTEFFDLQSGTAGVVQYQLDLKSIHKYKAATKASAAKAHARESKAGREALRQLVADDPAALSSWDYSKSLGLLVEKDPASTPDVANVPSSIADAAAGAAVGQTSTVLTVPTAP
ncbi:MAG: hypothetical protein JWQ18_337 [Conexibacter sp.]|nr:hypothetical protein [Conexibacter sp.]